MGVERKSRKKAKIMEGGEDESEIERWRKLLKAERERERERERENKPKRINRREKR